MPLSALPSASTQDGLKASKGFLGKTEKAVFGRWFQMGERQSLAEADAEADVVQLLRLSPLSNAAADPTPPPPPPPPLTAFVIERFYQRPCGFQIRKRSDQLKQIGERPFKHLVSSWSKWGV